MKGIAKGHEARVEAAMAMMAAPRVDTNRAD